MVFCKEHGDDYQASCVECYSALCASQEKRTRERRETNAKIYDGAVTRACARCMVDIETEVSRSIYSRLNGPVLRQLLAENPFRDKE